MPWTVYNSDGKVLQSAEVGSNSITNAKMADDAIGVAELSATGTASSSVFLRGDNAWAAAGGGLVFIDTAVASNSASLTVDDLDSTYDTYLITISDIHLVTDGADLWMRIGDLGGISLSNYISHMQNLSTADAAYSATLGGTSNKMLLSGTTVGNYLREGISGVIWLPRPGDATTGPSLTGHMSWFDPGNQERGGLFIGHHRGTQVITQIQILASSGNITSGRLTVHGVTNA